MAAASSTMGLAVSRAKEREAVSDPFAPDIPLVWWYGQLRYVDAPDAYYLLRLRNYGRRLWYDFWKMPRVSAIGEVVFPDDRASRGSYAEARALCRTRNCYVRALPYGQTPFGDELFDNPTFIRPLIEPERDAQMSAAYTLTLEDFICPDLKERVRQLTTALAAVGAALDEDEHG